MASDTLCEAIARAISCRDRERCGVNSLCDQCDLAVIVYAAVAPLLDAERERRKIATDELRRVAKWVECLAARAEVQSEAMRGRRFDHLANEAARDARSHRATAASLRAAIAESDATTRGEAVKLDNRGLSMKPYRMLKDRKTAPNWWCYEEPHGISVFHQTDSGISHALVQMKMIRAYLMRRDAEIRRRKRDRSRAARSKSRTDEGPRKP